MIKDTTYSPQELFKIFDSDTYDIEGDEAQKVFLELKRRIECSIEITYTESLYFYLCLKHARDAKYGKVEDYAVCNEHIFTDLYRIYAPNNLSCLLNAKDLKNTQIPLYKRREHEQILSDYLIEWGKKLEEATSDEKIIATKNETIKDIRKLEQISSGHGSNWVKAQKRKIYLRSKFIYNVALEIIEWNGELINVNITTLLIKFNAKSLIHIMFRHYGQIAKPSLIVNEDYFAEGVHYSMLGEIIRSILIDIYSSGLLIPKASDVINVRYKSNIYLIVIRNSNIITFYPISSKSKLQRLTSRYNLQLINKDLELYMKK